MTACAWRAADLTAVDAFAEHDHFSCRTFRDGKICRPPSIGMCAFRRFCRFFDDVTCGRRETGTRSGVRCASAGASMIDNLVDTPPNVVGNVERAIGPHRQAGGAMLGLAGRLHRTSETICEDFTLAGGMIANERLINHVVTALRIGSTVP